MGDQNNHWTQFAWTLVVLAGLLIMLTSYIWIIYDPARIGAGSLLATVGITLSVAGLSWKSKAPREATNQSR